MPCSILSAPYEQLHSYLGIFECDLQVLPLGINLVHKARECLLAVPANLNALKRVLTPRALRGCRAHGTCIAH